MLRRVCDPVEQVDKELRKQLEEMADLMYSNSGLGLSAPQVGLSQRMLVMNLTGKRRDGVPLVFINPVIRKRTGKPVAAAEGCLSLPGDWGMVTRWPKVIIKAWTPDGRLLRRPFTGLASRIIQHEMDHLDGILFIDKVEEEA